jgi:hypothetical protein
MNVQSNYLYISVSYFITLAFFISQSGAGLCFIVNYHTGQDLILYMCIDALSLNI